MKPFLNANSIGRAATCPWSMDFLTMHEKAREVAASKNPSMDALVTIALSQSLSRMIADPQLEERAARATGKGVDKFLAQVPASEPPEWDRIPDGYRRK